MSTLMSRDRRAILVADKDDGNETDQLMIFMNHKPFFDTYLQDHEITHQGLFCSDPTSVVATTAQHNF